MQNKKKKAPVQDRHHTHTYLNTVKNACLTLIITFLILAWFGTKTGNEAITLLGLGLGASGGLIQARINLKEED